MSAQTAIVAAEPRPRPSLIAKMANAYQMDPAKFALTIKATCIKGKASDEQFAAFLMVADKYGLNPLTKEIYAFPQDGGIVPIVGVDGWARIINNHPAFDGMEFSDERDESGKIVSITCRMFRKDRERATEATEYLAECARGTQPWKQWPARMLRHKAMIQAARYAFGFTGIIEEDEWERRKDAERAPQPSMRDAFRNAPAIPYTQARAEAHDPDTGEIIDADPVRDINDDIEDPEPGDTPSQPVQDAGEGSPSEASQADASPEQSPEPASGDASAAQSDDEQPEGARRFYAATMKEIKSATTLGQRENALKGATANGYWDMLTDEQQAQIKKAAG